VLDHSRNNILQQALKKRPATQGKITVKPQSAEEPASCEVKHETSDNENHTHTHNPKRDKKANPELECSRAFLSEFRGRELPLLYVHVMKALPPQHLRYKHDKL